MGLAVHCKLTREYGPEPHTDKKTGHAKLLTHQNTNGDAKNDPTALDVTATMAGSQLAEFQQAREKNTHITCFKDDEAIQWHLGNTFETSAC